MTCKYEYVVQIRMKWLAFVLVMLHLRVLLTESFNKLVKFRYPHGQLKQDYSHVTVISIRHDCSVEVAVQTSLPAKL